jgi:hypothetical protein
VKREIFVRGAVYPGWVAKGKMKAEKAAHEIEVMNAVLETIYRMEGLDK